MKLDEAWERLTQARAAMVEKSRLRTEARQRVADAEKTLREHQRDLVDAESSFRRAAGAVRAAGDALQQALPGLIAGLADVAKEPTNED